MSIFIKPFSTYSKYLENFQTMINQEEAEKNRDTPKKNTVKDYFDFGEVFGYFFRKKDPSRPSNFNIRMMHGINKISIIIFLLGILFIILKRFIF